METKIKIAHLVCVIPPYGGGLGVAAHNQAEILVDAGFDVTVITSKDTKHKEIKRKYKIDQLRSILKLGHGVLMPGLFKKLFAFDIVHLHFPFFGATFITVLVKLIRREKMKLIVSYHQDLILKGWRALYYKLSMFLLTPILLRLAEKIIVSTFDYAEGSAIKKYFLKNRSKFIEIPFAVDAQFSPQPKNQELLKKFEFSTSDFIVIFVGGLDWAHYFKGVDYLIQTMPLLPYNIKALIVGAGNLKEKYEKQTHELCLEKRVKFAGYIDENLKSTYYNLADIVILPSINKNEAFGIVLIEGLACGKPILASNLRGVRNVVEDGINGFLLEPKNTQDIATKIKLLYQDRNKLKEFSANALRSAQKYSLKVVSERLNELYLEIMNKN